MLKFGKCGGISGLLTSQRSQPFSKMPARSWRNNGFMSARNGVLMASTALLAGFTLHQLHRHNNYFSMASALSTSPAMVSEKGRVRKIKLSELAENESLLRGGDPSKRAIAIFYDSRVGTHSEYVSILGVKQTFARLANYEVLLVDLAEQSVQDVTIGESFLSRYLSIDLAKVGRKTNPSVFLQINDSLHKVRPDDL